LHQFLVQAMLEISIFCVIVFAIGYWATLFIMGRREDVLHGEFVEAEPELMAAPAGVPMPIPVAAPIYAAPSRRTPVKPMLIKPMPARPVAAPPPIAASEPEPDPVETPAVSAPAAPVPPPAAAGAPVNTDSLQSLLVSIKQELKNAAQI
jgi:hypothetical protein